VRLEADAVIITINETTRFGPDVLVNDYLDAGLGRLAADCPGAGVSENPFDVAAPAE